MLSERVSLGDAEYPFERPSDANDPQRFQKVRPAGLLLRKRTVPAGVLCRQGFPDQQVCARGCLVLVPAAKVQNCEA